MSMINPELIPKVLEIYLEIIQYPLLAPAIRQRMREELFRRGVTSPAVLEREVKAQAIESQEREGLKDPFVEESEADWQVRLAHHRDHLTDFFFAHNLPHNLFVDIVREVVGQRLPSNDVLLTFNPELAPWALLFHRGAMYEGMPAEEQQRFQHHLSEIIAVIVKGLISERLPFVGMARDLFSIADLDEIRQRRIGRGKIGGKAAGMMIAWKILNEGPDASDGIDLTDRIAIPRSRFIGADVFYDFIALNNLHEFHNQKYKSREQIETDYPAVRAAFVGGRFPEGVVDELRGWLVEMGKQPIIVRSSSLLEDNYETSFAGKYDSFFLPNQGTVQENLAALLLAISRVYASIYSPSALFYRQQMSLLDYDERMAVLLQEVAGEQHDGYYFPALAGVAFSQNPFRWTPKIRREEGFVRLVFGLGTRAVERVANDYPRMVALSHPDLRPEVSAAAIRRYSQHQADVLNLVKNSFQTVPVAEVLSMGFPSARLLVSVDHGDYLQPPMAYDPTVSPDDLVLTLDNLLTRTDFVALIKTILSRLSAFFGTDVDIEFAVEIVPGRPRPDFRVVLLQCRPQASRRVGEGEKLPAQVDQQDILFTAHRMVPDGCVARIHHVVLVDPRAYARIPDDTTRLQVARVVGRLNELLAPKSFLLMGPGRWGTSNLELGVRVTYADIYKTAMLVEIGLSEGDSAPEASYGTHFFQDLVEANIYPLAVFPNEGDTQFNWEFFENAPNRLAELLPRFADYARYVRVIDVPAAAGGRLVEVAMNADENKALAYLRHYEA